MIYQTLHTPPITPEESWRLEIWSGICKDAIIVLNIYLVEHASVKTFFNIVSKLNYIFVYALYKVWNMYLLVN